MIFLNYGARKMSTRSNTVIKDLKTGEEEILYRHFDGYPSGAGFDQLGYLTKIEDESICRGKKITIDFVKDWFLKNGEGYEETDSIHGDVEYVYFVEITGNDDVPLKLKAYTTRMYFDNDGKSAALKDDITDELLNEYLESEEADSDDEEEDTNETNRDILREKVMIIADRLWKDTYRNHIVDDIMKRIDENKMSDNPDLAIEFEKLRELRRDNESLSCLDDLLKIWDEQN